jgi:hypothetical protein
MPTTTSKNFFIALFLSLTLTLIVAVTYLLYPLVSMGVAISSNPQTTGSSTFMVSRVSVRKIAFIEPILFLVIFALLQRSVVKQ